MSESVTLKALCHRIIRHLAPTAVGLAIHLVLTSGASADDRPRFEQVARWAVQYEDKTLGLVDGIATCDWSVPECRVRLVDPTHGNAVVMLEARGSPDIILPRTESEPLRITLHGRSPYGSQVKPPPDAGVATAGAENGETVSVQIKNGQTQSTTLTAVAASAAADRDSVTLELWPAPDGSLQGEWFYYANPVTERAAGGVGRVGAFHLVPDTMGNFLGQQIGGEVWKPLPARIWAAFVIDQQEGYNGAAPLYWRDDDGGAHPDTRSLVLIGDDLPIEGDQSLAPIVAKDGVSYELVRVEGGTGQTPEEAAQIKRARLELGKKLGDHLTDQAKADWAHTQAVIVRAKIRAEAEAGRKTFRWSGGVGHWPLQFGDNTAELRFVQAYPGLQPERIGRAAIPQTVAIEIETGDGLPADSLAVRLDVPGQSTANLQAVRVPGGRRLYRTPPIVLSGIGDAPKAGSAQVVSLGAAKTIRLLADIDRGKESFLKATPALLTAYRRAPANRDPVFAGYLGQAAGCNGATVADPASFASEAAETLSSTISGGDVRITYGDHAAMLMLRDEFASQMLMQVANADAASQTDELVDAWYEIMHANVTRAPDSALATTAVAGPTGGKTPFSNAYLASYRLEQFKADSTPDGDDRYRTWRRQATHSAITAYKGIMSDTANAARSIDPCDRRKLLGLTGAGFQRIIAGLSPDLRRFDTASGQWVPDAIARGAVSGIQTLGPAVQTLDQSIAEGRKAVIAGATALLMAPAAFAEGAAVSLGGLIGGLLNFGQESAHEIYETYSQHQEVAFAFSASAVIGLDRYFTAESLATPWWRTGVSIFAQAAMQALVVKASWGQVTEGLAEWRAARTLAGLTAADRAAIQALPAAQEADVALVTLKTQEEIAETGIVGVRAGAPARAYAELAAEQQGASPTTKFPEWMIEQGEAEHVEQVEAAIARGPAGAPQPAMDLPQQMFEEVRQQAAEAVGPEFDLAEDQSNVDLAEAATAPKDAAPGPARLVAPDAAKLPSVADKAKKWDNYAGRELGKGSYMKARVLDSLPPGVTPDKSLGNEQVLKVLLDEATAKADRLLYRNVFARMKKAWELLNSKGITEQCPTQFIEEDQVLLQKLLKPGDDLKMFKGTVEGFAKWKADPDNKLLQEAVARLYNKLGDRGLVWVDGHIENIYFEREGGTWVAKMLDQDFVDEYKPFWKNFNLRDAGSVRTLDAQAEQEGDYVSSQLYLRTMMSGAGRPLSIKEAGDAGFSSAKATMQKLLEIRSNGAGGAWLKFAEGKGGLPGQYVEGGWLDPQIVKRVMPDLPYVPDLPVPPIKAGGLLPRIPPANDNDVILAWAM